VKPLTHLRHWLSNFPAVVALISFLLVFLFFTIRADNFLSLVSLTNILTIASIKGIFVVSISYTDDFN
jgi:ribose/xylose/arabinose/galactoside ABC-type transport system permease subunit